MRPKSPPRTERPMVPAWRLYEPAAAPLLVVEEPDPLLVLVPLASVGLVVAEIQVSCP